jgi:starvation-inducible DNA-binding protein
MKTHQLVQSKNYIANSLQGVLASTYGLYLMTHNYHWNVEGERFYPLHKMFEDQYNELFQAVDVVAERIRALGDYALPFEGEDILESSKMVSNALNKEADSGSRAQRMVMNLMNANEEAVKNCQAAKKAAQGLQDDETENLMVERITAHQKAIWMLRSSLK